MNNQLIKCKACGNELAVTANQCPKCGGVNDYIHPQIERLLQNGSNAIKMPYQYQYDRFSMIFYVRDKAPLWQVQWHLKGYSITWFAVIILNYLPWQNIIGYAFGSLLGILLEISFYVIMVAWGIGLCIWGWAYGTTIGGLCGPHKIYSIDFRSNPPTINTNDAEYWKEVDDFFKNDQIGNIPIAS